MSVAFPSGVLWENARKRAAAAKLPPIADMQAQWAANAAQAGSAPAAASLPWVGWNEANTLLSPLSNGTAAATANGDPYAMSPEAFKAWQDAQNAAIAQTQTPQFKQAMAASEVMANGGNGQNGKQQPPQVAFGPRRPPMFYNPFQSAILEQMVNGIRNFGPQMQEGAAQIGGILQGNADRTFAAKLANQQAAMQRYLADQQAALQRETLDKTLNASWRSEDPMAWSRSGLSLPDRAAANRRNLALKKAAKKAGLSGGIFGIPLNNAEAGWQNNQFGLDLANKYYGLAESQVKNQNDLLKAMWGIGPTSGAGAPQGQAGPPMILPNSGGGPAAGPAVLRGGSQGGLFNSVNQGRQAQADAGTNLYNSALSQIGSNAMPRPSIGQVNFQGAAGGAPLAGMRPGLPAGMAGAGGGPFSKPGGTYGFGITQPNIWGNAQSNALKRSLGNAAQGAIGAITGDSTQAGNMKNYLGGLAGRAYTAVAAPAMRAQAQASTNAQEAAADARNRSMYEMAKLTGAGYDDWMQKLQQTNRMLRQMYA